MKLQTKNKISTILKIVATLSIIPLIFSTFFSGYDVTSSGTQVNKPVAVSIFEFTGKKETLLTFAFVAIIMELLIILFMTFFGMTQTMKKKQDKFLGIVVAVFEMIIAILPLVLVAVYCNKNTEEGLKYALGVCPIIYTVCGLVFGGLMTTSYVLYEEPKHRKRVVNRQDNTEEISKNIDAHLEEKVVNHEDSKI